MKLYENKVGRPSNDTLKKRRIMYLLIGVFSIVIVGCSSFLFKGLIELNSLKGAAEVNKPSNVSIIFNTSLVNVIEKKSIKK